MTSKKIILFAPKVYSLLSKEEKAAYCNGCGAKEGICIPSTFYGLDISEACNIHDFMYAVGTTLNHKDKADRAFLNNLTRIIVARSNWITKPLRLKRAKLYYNAVKYFGGKAYWAGKNLKSEELQYG